MPSVDLLWLISKDRSLPNIFENVSKSIINPFEDPHLSESILPSLVVLDPDSYEVNGCVDWIKNLRVEAAQIPVMILSHSKEQEMVFAFLNAGAAGYLLKSEQPHSIQQAVVDLLEGDSPLSSKVATFVVEKAIKRFPQESEKFGLKPHELELLELLAEGLTKREIGVFRDRNIHTIDNQIRRVYRKLGVTNIGAALGKAFRERVIS